jgi:hypothetical protein
MSEAISVLEDAWSVAYKEVGKEGEDKVPTIDMITGGCEGGCLLRGGGVAKGTGGRGVCVCVCVCVCVSRPWDHHAGVDAMSGADNWQDSWNCSTED